MSSKVIVLDGSKGAGKSTISQKLLEYFDGVQSDKFVVLSIDKIRRDLGLKATSENNETAFQNLLSELEDLLKNEKNIIIDCGLVADKLARLELLLKKYSDLKLYKFFLDGDYEILKNRVKIRDQQEGKIFNSESFDRVYRLVRDKSFDGYMILDVEVDNVDKVLEKIILLVG